MNQFLLTEEETLDAVPFLNGAWGLEYIKFEASNKAQLKKFAEVLESKHYSQGTYKVKGEDVTFWDGIHEEEYMEIINQLKKEAGL